MPGSRDHAIVRAPDSAPCEIYVPPGGVDVDAITFAGSQNVVLRASTVTRITVGLVRVSMNEGNGVFVKADELQLEVRRQIRVEQGELLWHGSHILCLGHASACPAVPHCNMTVSRSGVASLIASDVSGSGAEAVWTLCLNFLVEEGGALNIGGRQKSRFNVRGGVLETRGAVQVADLDEDQDARSMARWRVLRPGTLTFGGWQLSDVWSGMVDDADHSVPKLYTAATVLGFPLEQAGSLKLGHDVVVQLAGGGLGTGSFLLEAGSRLVVRPNFEFADTARYEGVCTGSPAECSAIWLQASTPSEVAASSVGLAGACEQAVAFVASVNLRFTGRFTMEASCSMRVEDVDGYFGALQGRGASSTDVRIESGASWNTVPSQNVVSPGILQDVSFLNFGLLHLEGYRVENTLPAREPAVENKLRGVTNLTSLRVVPR